ncbi:hypothetical protein BaRGS_00002095 [Batillaria attramentaria]|uniref:ubiquitinyl hydrolase 1 n=1 Tax=Batillaria attramentaria TaxID=370345 RepID=A0ABD0M4M9_9CAEN
MYAAFSLIALQLVLCHLSKDGFHATYSNEQPLSDVPESNHVYAIEMHPSESEPAGQSACYETPTIQILLLHVETDRHSPERFCSPEVIQISRETNLKNLQKEILHRLGDAVKREVFAQRLHSLFRLQIVDGSSRKTYLSEEVQMPLYTETVDRVLSMFGEEFGPQHLKLIAEWNPEVKEAVIQDDMEHFVEHVSVNRVQASATQPVEISLDECFQLYTQEEKLAGEDAWLCPHCKKPQKGATKTLGLWSLPDILVLHLKRFKQTGMRRNKLNMLVNFPVDNLDMTTHVVQQGIQVRDDMVYDLIGVANHYGNMNGGHYTAFCKNTVDGTWRNFDDRRVQALASDQVVTKSAYILFYQRRSLTKLINQRLHTATHWVFSLESLMKPHSDKSTSPQRRNSLGSPTKRGDGYGDDLRQAGIAPIVRRPFSKEWNGPSSPTRRPNIRPLTPQPQRKHMPFAMDNYDQSPTVIKPKPLFKTSRPTLSRQLSDAAVRAKRPPTQDPGMTDGHQRPADKGTDSGYRSSASGQFQPQSLQVQLPPRPSTSARSPDILGTDVPKGRSSDILQPQQVQLPPKQQQEDGQDRRVLQQHRSSAAFKGTEQARVGSQSSRVSGSSSYHSEAQPPSVDVRVVDSPSFHSYQDHPACVRVIQQPVSIPPRSGRPWQYESQSSQSSRDTQSSQDSHSPQGDHVVTKTHFSNGQETFDWRQPEASTGAEVTARPKPTSSNGPRVVTAKPPVPPKTITGRTADAWRKVDSGRSAGSSSSETNAMLQPVAGTSSSLTSPPSPAPRESVRDIQRRISQRQAQQPEGLTQGERRAGPRDGPQEAPQVADRQAPDERPILREGQFNQLRNRFSDIPGEQVQGRRRSQNLADQKFATIARGNRDARSEPRDPIAPPMVPRSATDHNIKFSSYGNYSPSHLSQQAQRSLAVGSRYSPQSDRTSFSSGSGGYPRSEWDRDHRYPAERDSVPVAPLYASRDQSSSVRENRTHIYRGPMFQLHRPRKTNESDAPSLRESSV